MRTKLPLIVAVVLGLVSFVGIGQYLEKSKQQNRVEMSKLLVAAVDKKAGDVLQPTDIKEAVMPATSVRAMGKVYGPDSKTLIAGSRLSKDVKEGEPLFPVTLQGSEMRAEGKRFVRLLQKDERAISIPIDSVGGVSQFLRPGDRVDILANLEVPAKTTKTYSVPNQGVMTTEEVVFNPTTVFLLESVRVLAVGGQYLDPEAQGVTGAVEGGTAGGTVTIAVNPREGQILSFAMRHGRGGAGGGGRSNVTFTLLLRPVGDTGTVTDRSTVNYDDFLNLTKLNELQADRNRRAAKEPVSPEAFVGGVMQQP